MYNIILAFKNTSSFKFKFSDTLQTHMSPIKMLTGLQEFKYRRIFIVKNIK